MCLPGQALLHLHCLVWTRGNRYCTWLEASRARAQAGNLGVADATCVAHWHCLLGKLSVCLSVTGLGSSVIELHCSSAAACCTAVQLQVPHAYAEIARLSQCIDMVATSAASMCLQIRLQ